MGLPYVIEYLLTLERPGGGRLVYGGASQLIIPIFPPNTSITLTSGPLGSDFAYIAFRGGLGPAMVPHAFYSWAQQYGSRQYDGQLGSWLLNNNLDFYTVVSAAEPSLAQITNQSPLCQYYEGYTFFLGIATEDDYALVMEALARRGTSEKIEKLAQEANDLLRAMAGIKPRPPLGEGQ